MREVSTGEAPRDVWRLMYCWICCSTGGEDGKEDGGCEQYFGEKQWRCTGRVTDAKFEEGEEREVTTRRGVRGGEVERKIQRCWEKTDRCSDGMGNARREMGSESAGVSGFSVHLDVE